MTRLSPAREKQLHALARDRRRLEERLRVNRQVAGKQLLEVSESEGETIHAAAEALGISRPAAYLLLEDARPES